MIIFSALSKVSVTRLVLTYETKRGSDIKGSGVFNASKIRDLHALKLHRAPSGQPCGSQHRQTNERVNVTKTFAEAALALPAQPRETYSEGMDFARILFSYCSMRPRSQFQPFAVKDA